jgi:hypothetical protein
LKDFIDKTGILRADEQRRATLPDGARSIWDGGQIGLLSALWPTW